MARLRRRASGNSNADDAGRCASAAARHRLRSRALADAGRSAPPVCGAKPMASTDRDEVSCTPVASGASCGTGASDDDCWRACAGGEPSAGESTSTDSSSAEAAHLRGIGAGKPHWLEEGLNAALWVGAVPVLVTKLPPPARACTVCRTDCCSGVRGAAAFNTCDRGSAGKPSLTTPCSASRSAS